MWVLNWRHICVNQRMGQLEAIPASTAMLFSALTTVRKHRVDKLSLLSVQPIWIIELSAISSAFALCCNYVAYLPLSQQR